MKHRQEIVDTRAKSSEFSDHDLIMAWVQPKMKMNRMYGKMILAMVQYLSIEELVPNISKLKYKCRIA
jgi:hypothetical protein